MRPHLRGIVIGRDGVECKRSAMADAVPGSAINDPTTLSVTSWMHNLFMLSLSKRVNRSTSFDLLRMIERFSYARACLGACAYGRDRVYAIRRRAAIEYAGRLKMTTRKAQKIQPIRPTRALGGLDIIVISCTILYRIMQ